MKKIVFLSSTDEGKEILKWLKGQDCEIVLADTENTVINHFPEYDFGFGFLYTHKIPSSEFLKSNKWINFHPGPLPNYRGRNLCYHAIMNSSATFGATIHFMNEKYDEGEIIEVVNFPIEKTDTAGDLNKKSVQTLIDLFKKYFKLIIQNEVIGTIQNEGVYYKKHEINNFLEVTDQQKKMIRALTVEDKFYPLIDMDGKSFKILPV